MTNNLTDMILMTISILAHAPKFKINVVITKLIYQMIGFNFLRKSCL